MKIYVTKYALTKGIQEFDADEVDGGMAIVVCGVGLYSQYYHGNEWHQTREAAAARAEEMRVKKLQSLERQIKKVSKLVF